jgi:hypothetical protein
VTNLGKKFYNSLKTDPKFSSALQNENNLQFCEICGYKKNYDKFFAPLSFVADFGSGIRDPGCRGWVKSGSGIHIPDPQH